MNPSAAAPDPSAAGRSVLLRFTGALEDARFVEAFALLSARWRAVTTPERLAADLRAAGPVAREATHRARTLAGSGAPLTPEGPRLRLDVGAGRSARLVEEPGGWRVDALE